MLYLLIAIYLPVKFEICSSFNTIWVFARSMFHCFRCNSNYFGFINIKKWRALSSQWYLSRCKVSNMKLKNFTSYCKIHILFLNIFTVSVSIATIFFSKSTKISDLHYLLNDIYPAVMFQMCSFNIYKLLQYSFIFKYFHWFCFHSNHFFY